MASANTMTPIAIQSTIEGTSPKVVSTYNGPTGSSRSRIKLMEGADKYLLAHVGMMSYVASTRESRITKVTKPTI